MQTVPRSQIATDARQRLSERLENWGECWRAKLKFMRREYAGRAVENAYRSRSALHWDYDEVVGTAPHVRSGVDPHDAQAIELAVTALDTYHHIILKGYYVRQWAPERTLRIARMESGVGNPRRGGDFEASLAMARVLLMSMLTSPAAIRRGRAAKTAALALDLPTWVD